MASPHMAAAAALYLETNPTDTTASYTCSWDTTAVANGTHTLSTKAYDTWNNMGESAPATLTFWLSVTSKEPAKGAKDVLYVEVVSGASATTVGTFSNLNRGPAGSYALKSFNLAPWRGQTVTLRFRATTNATRPTVLSVDDVSLR